MTAQTILPANTLSSGGYDVDNSVRFNDGDSAYMHKTAAAGSRRIFTFSTWFKRGQLGTNQQLFNSYSAANAGGFAYIQFVAVEDNVIGDRISLEVYGSQILRTTQVLRDPSAWYHLVVAVDTTNGTANNRCRMYLNGTEITSFAARNNPDQNFDFAFNQNNIDMYLGSNNYGGNKGNYFDGYMAETVWIDGTQYAASDFGEFDSDSGIWKPIDVSGLTFGTNGFYLDFEASGNLGNDVNGGTDLTEVNLAATDQSTDTCTNNFAVLNPLLYGSNYTWSEGNLQFAQTATNWDTTYSSIGVTKGKWYMEFKGKVGAYYDIGVTDVVDTTNNLTVNSGCVAYKSNGEFAAGGAVGDGLPSTITDPASNTYTANDIIGIALDMDNETVYFAKNGTYEVNSDPTSGASKTGGTDLPNSNSLYFFAFAAYKGSAASGTGQVNFGGGSVDAISSGNADADGHGNFEFAVPSGYFALCTKNLAEYG